MTKPLKVRNSKSKYGRGRYGWTLKHLKEGFENFYIEYGRYPLASDLEKSSKHLPSIRQLQYKYGGLKSLRKKIGLKITNYSMGSHRKKLLRQLILDRYFLKITYMKLFARSLEKCLFINNGKLRKQENA